MKILVFNLKNFGTKYAVNTLKKLGHTVTLVNTVLDNTRVNPAFDQLFLTETHKMQYDFVFTFNYYPIISTNCNRHGLKYVSWIYDNPLVSLYSCTVINPCNYIFLFDNAMYNELKSYQIQTVYYLPLAADTTALDTFVPNEEIHRLYDCDVSFVGSLYNEKHCLYNKLNSINPYIKGYLDGLIQAQSSIYGYFFLQEYLSPEVLAELQKAVPYQVNSDGTESPEYIYSRYFMARRVTEIERSTILKKVSDCYNTNIYTAGDTSDFPQIHNKGPIDYYDTMPYIFKCSKINLNITLKSIESGIPLRAIDILGSGGFLLTNYQRDFIPDFEPDKDFVFYEDYDDLLAKIKYYLIHEDERKAIAQNGYQKIKEFHVYEKKLQSIIDIVKGSN